MKIGICCGIADAALAAQLGFDYIEAGMSHIGDLDEAAWADWRALAQAIEIPVLAMNVMLPGRFRLTGPEADHDAAFAWLETAYARAAEVGVERVVFGSGGARNLPEGTTQEEGLDQLASFLDRLAVLARQHDIRVGIEALRAHECNIVNLQTEAAALAKRVGRPEIGITVDNYHMSEMDEPVTVLPGIGSLIVHSHISSAKRSFPQVSDPDDYAAFFEALRQARYDGTMSIEASDERPLEIRGVEALRTLRPLA